jgi:hypothetical protein
MSSRYYPLTDWLVAQVVARARHHCPIGYQASWSFNPVIMFPLSRGRNDAFRISRQLRDVLQAEFRARAYRRYVVINTATG